MHGQAFGNFLRLVRQCLNLIPRPLLSIRLKVVVLHDDHAGQLLICRLRVATTVATSRTILFTYVFIFKWHGVEFSLGQKDPTWRGRRR